MAVDAPLLTRQRIVAAKIETTTGTAIALAAADAAMNVEDATLEEDIPENERPGQSSFDPLASVPGGRSARLKFKMKLHGTATSLWVTNLMVACGMANSAGAMTPSTGSASAPTLTMGLYEDGVFRSIAGASGNYTITGESGNPWVCEFDFLGCLQDDSDVALISPTYPTVIPPRWAGTVNTVAAGFSPKLSKFTFSPNNELKLREKPDSDTGYHACSIVGRKPEITIDPEAQLVATRPWLTNLKASTQAALSFIAGTTATNILTLAAPKAQPVVRKRGDRGGLMTDEITLRLGRSTDAGDDSFSLTIT